MISGQRVTVILPAYNAAKTLERTYAEIPHDIVDEVILTDDASRDDTVARSQNLGIHTLRHDTNKGYGANQKTCYAEALSRGADIVVMLHPDYQYSPRLVTAMASMVASGHYDVVLASRILGHGALAGGMPLYKYIANRFLTVSENLLLGLNLSEYHTGYRAWSRRVLETLPLARCSSWVLAPPWPSPSTSRGYFQKHFVSMSCARGRASSQPRHGASGQSCFGYRPRISRRASTQPLRQNDARSPVIAIGRPAGESSEICNATRPSASFGVASSP